MTVRKPLGLTLVEGANGSVEVEGVRTLGFPLGTVRKNKSADSACRRTVFTEGA